MKKTLFMTMAVAVMSSLALAGCNTSSGNTVKPMLGKVSIGILQPNHPALEAATNGFTAVLTEKANAGEFDINDKFTFTVVNPSQSSSDISIIAKNMIDTYDMCLGVATDPAISLVGAASEKGSEKPILFTAITDPVNAGLVKSMNNGSGFATGTSDMNPVQQQIELIKEVVPGADKVGILFTRSEKNSVVQADMAEAAIKANGMTVVRKSCTGPSDLSAVATDLVNTSGLDAIYIPTDNNIAANTGAVSDAVQGKGILVVCGEENMLKGCGTATLSIDYNKLGRLTGEMAAKIIKGEKHPSQIPVGSLSKDECEYVMSTANAAKAGITIPESALSAHTWRNVD